MPIYEYRCPACGKSFDAMQKVADAPITVCRLCNAEGVTKALTAPGFALKGTGWYATDFKGGTPATKTEGASDAKATPASATDGGSSATASPAAAPTAMPAAAPAVAASGGSA